MQFIRRRIVPLSAAALISACTAGLSGCGTVPNEKDRATFVSDSRSATRWFERNVAGLSEQIDESAGYIIFPEVGQWGFLFGGGQFGRGLVADESRAQIGWASVSTPSLGLQAGVRGFKMLLVFEDEATLDRYMQNRLSGSVSGVAVAAESGASTKAPFEDGVAVYQGASTGLMAGVNIGLDVIRFEPLSD